MTRQRKASQHPPAPAPNPATLSILEALDHPDLFAPHFRDGTWSAWRAVLAGIFGLPMTEAEAELFRRHTGRQTLPTAPFKEVALVVGRRGGKSRILALIAAYLATFRDYEPYLAPGEVATIAVIAADRRQARAIFRYIEGLLHAVPVLAPMVEESTAESVTLNNRVVIEVHTASFRVTRGYTFAAVLADETAFWRDENSLNPAEEIFRAIRPGLATIPGSMLLQGSSPYRKAGLLYSTYRRHFGKDDGRVLVWQASTADMNPSIDPAIIEEAYEEDPESAAAEFGGQFRNDLADFVTREVVDACTIPGRRELPPIREGAPKYWAFVDPSGGSSDSMTLAIAHQENGRAVLDAVRERKPPFSPDDVVQEFAALLDSYGIRSVEGDRYGGEWPRERFRAHGISYEPAEKPKSDIYRELLPVLNGRQCELLDLPRLSTQLCGLERRTARGGRDSIDHAPGAHDDLANAVAGALVRAAQRNSLWIWERLAS
ncbi:MAG: hypothetical protein QJR07_15620 [Acetobacteraceae bacterium]|nr:hypothetical protein [Acetobacteraceae bacterium]